MTGVGVFLVRRLLARALNNHRLDESQLEVVEVHLLRSPLIRLILKNHPPVRFRAVTDGVELVFAVRKHRVNCGEFPASISIVDYRAGYDNLLWVDDLIVNRNLSRLNRRTDYAGCRLHAHLENAYGNFLTAIVYRNFCHYCAPGSCDVAARRRLVCLST